MLIFDLESNGLLNEATALHCVSLWSSDTEARLFHDDSSITPRAGSVAEGVRAVLSAPEVAGHNIIRFDLPLIEKLHGAVPSGPKPFDTMVAARVIWSNIADLDFAMLRKGRLPPEFQKKGLVGSHSLEAWGYRLGNYKGDYDGGWGRFSQDMADYAVQDVVVTRALFNLIQSKNYSQKCLDLEMKVAQIIARQERYGFAFDVKAAEELYAALQKRRVELEATLQSTFEPWQAVDKVITPKRDNARLGYKAGVPVTKYKTVTFNPASRDHIADRLMTLRGWKPEEFTDGGKPKVDETILEALPYPEAKLLAEYLMVQKRLGQIGDGKEAWLKCVRNGRIYGSVNTCGAVTGRMTHQRPNVAQTPRVGTPYGAECRALFTVTPDADVMLVGCDAEGLELRMLAHYMARWDGGAYAETVVNGRKEDGTDVHSVNMRGAGLRLRDSAKTFIYALIYGAGDYKLGTIVHADFDDEKRARFDAKFTTKGQRQRAFVRLGKDRRARLMESLPALGEFVKAVKSAAKRGYLIGLDGRRLHVRSEHAAPNTLLQSGGAVVMKKALVLFEERFAAPKRSEGVTVEYVANIHDEVQMEVTSEHADAAGRAFAECIRLAGEHFGLRCPLAGSYSVGRNWKETH